MEPGTGLPGFRGSRPVLGLPSALAAPCRLDWHPTDPGERDRRLPDGHHIPAPHLHAVHEVKHVAFRPAATAEAVKHPISGVDRAARLGVVVEGAADLELRSPARREVVVGQDGDEIRLCLDLFKVYAIALSHLAPTRTS